MNRLWLLGSVLVAMTFAGTAFADSSTESQLDDMDRRVDRLERRVTDTESALHQSGGAGIAFFLFGAFCALWAQNTGRSAWLWFFLGLLFNIITVIFLLSKNADDRNARGPGAPMQ